MKNNSVQKDLSVIIPFRYDAELPYLIDRLKEQCDLFSSESNVEFIVVDSGSPDKYKFEVQNVCNSYGIKYIYHNSVGQKFSIGEARDIGVEYASGRLVSFLDVDLRVEQGFWDRLLKFSKSYGIFDYKKNFFVIPCLYLSPEGADFFAENQHDGSCAYSLMISYMRGEKDYVESLAPCSSVMVVNRHHYMAIGGHRPEFRGHGYEDFELYHRLMVLDGTIPRADNYYHDNKSWGSSTYNGFRSQLAILGRAALMANLFVIHLWHPRPKRSSFYNGMQANREIWLDIFKEFDTTGAMPAPLVSSEARKEKVLYFGKFGDNAPNCLREIFPYLGNIMYIGEHVFCDENKKINIDDFVNFLKINGISRILFPNPYGNDHRLAIYNWCRSVSFPYLVFERGALPESWFFDKNGFNADSLTYSEDVWNNHLSQEDISRTESYIYSVLGEQRALEEQGLRLGGEGLSQKIGVGNRKVLFVPLQRPSDTVIKYFSGDQNGYEKFSECIDSAAAILKRLGWIVLCKKHPLETETPALKNVIFVDEKTNFLDLLELADAVALINSGVGVYSMMMQKPTFIFGDAFYAFSGLNKKINNYDVNLFVEEITKNNSFDYLKMIKFIYYLHSVFYSYGIPNVKIRNEADGSKRSITTGIDFYKIKIAGEIDVNFKRDNRLSISKSAPLFERYSLDIFNKTKKGVAPIGKVTSSSLPENDRFEKILKTSKGTISDLKKINQTRRNKFHAKLLKFKNNPKKFFLDSKKPYLKYLSKFF